MKLSVDQLAHKLEGALGSQAVSCNPAGTSAFSVDGQWPALVCRPSTAPEVGAAVRVCAEADAAITPYGGGTALAIGNPPRRLVVAISCSRLDGLVEHDDANLTATVQAGMAVARLQDSVAPRKQFLPVDVPFPDRATVGGMIAVNVNGPRRSAYGSIRDLVIGIKAVLATGEQIRAGGKVVKNVAGYDMGKLFVGSLGTLGIVTEATLRMAPLPRFAATLLTCGTLSQLIDLADQIAQSRLLPAALVILRAAAHSDDAGGTREFRLALWADGFPEVAARHFSETRAMADRIGLQTELLEGDAHVRLWERVRNFPLAAHPCMMRLVVPRGSLAVVLQAIAGSQTGDGQLEVIADMSAGTVWVGTTAEDTSAERFAQWGALAREHDGHATMVVAPVEVKKTVDVWGAAPAAVALMRRVKQQFDPQDLLNPGRFVGGI